MKVPVIDNVKTSLKKLNLITKQAKSIDLKPIKNYSQYMKEYGLK